MTEHLPIQRWKKIFTRYPASELLPNESGEYVTYADHLAALRSCEERVLDEALAQARAREVNGVTFAQAWALATNACIDAFYSRISDSDLDDLLSADEKDIVAHAIRNARQRGN